MLRKFACTAIAVLGLSVSAPLAAQDSNATTLSEVTPDPALTAETVTDEQVVAFVQALAAIRQVSGAYTGRIDAETDGSKRAARIDEANAAILGAIEGIENLSPQEYVAIDRAAQSDKALFERIATVIQSAPATPPKSDTQDQTRCVMGKCE